MNVTNEEVEHPAHRAARMIKELHEDNLRMMDNGHVFLRDGVNINEDMRKASLESIEECEVIMQRSQHMDAKLWKPAEIILNDLTSTIDQAKEQERTLAATIPEIGNYDHET